MDNKLIEKINSKSPFEQGILKEPYGIPCHIKELVIYGRYETGGVSGGCCWDNSDPQPYTVDEEPENRFIVLDMVLEELCPDISYIQYKKITKLIHDNTETEYEYYGNSTEWKCEYVVLSELESLIKKWGE